ncbi:helix-turn-helix domain-containing protein [Staphylococcus epidermidis]|uniref:helix-turn-helix domain-containing protein n=1 Tax=Staphylococcus epidermidis TaxID=1282 RepID=UPI001EF87C05|nr:helix-turn-helix transcriptional regulator [Staphylococcus epidermidis]MCG7834336.1 helix-turn-helix transcriptional regulator [Staphylococcus epidermidis]MDF1461801.1 helix-turn-helix transcriptional regulator [Staphylococcus epidermidis]
MKAKRNVLKKEIFSNGYSIKEFSEKVNISRTYMSSVVTRKKGLSPQKAKNVASTLGVEIKDVFDIEKEEVK